MPKAFGRRRRKPAQTGHPALCTYMRGDNVNSDEIFSFGQKILLQECCLKHKNIDGEQ
jgi:hypothetical protein